MQEVPNRIARRYLISGRVQGVGFRAFVLQAAVELGLAGWVRNLSDGRVEALAEGSQRQLGELRALLARGPALSRVDAVEESVVDAGCDGARFEMRPTR